MFSTRVNLKFCLQNILGDITSILEIRYLHDSGDKSDVHYKINHNRKAETHGNKNGKSEIIDIAVDP